MKLLIFTTMLAITVSVAGTTIAVRATTLRHGQQVSTNDPIVVIAEKRGGRALWQLESKPVPKENALQMLREFGSLLGKRGRDTQVFVLVEGSLPINEFQEITGIAGKAGFVNFRFFTFGSDRRYMVETKFGVAVPFTASPRTD